MTQNEIVWALFSIIQLGVISFIGYWTRRVQRLEDVMATTMEMRTQMLIEYQGRISKLEAQFVEIIKSLERIERRLERADTRLKNHEEEDNG